jgi:hypothetical protein
MSEILLGFLVFSAGWLCGAGVSALLCDRKWKRRDHALRTACAFDPVAAKGIERGDLRGMKIGGRK